jgi:FG-GAP-like repeat/PQQ-like domain
LLTLRMSGMACVAVAALLPARAGAADWPTFHGDNTRQGNDAGDPGLSSAVPVWTSTALDGSLYGQPVVVGSQVVVATENDTVYALDASTGSVQWARHLGTPRTSNFPCGNINPLGITSTPVIDGGNVFAVAEVQVSSTSFSFELASINLASGVVNWTKNIDPPDPKWNANYQQQRGALLATGGRVVVGFGGLLGDCGAYHGYVVGYPESGTGSVSWWSSAQVVTGDNQGAVWAAGGLSQDAAGYVYASTGNSSQRTAGDAYDYSDGVIKLNPGALQPGAPVDYFAPSTWAQDNAGDVDLGSTTPLQLPNGRVFIVGKSGNGYLLSTSTLGHIGGAVAQHRVCSATNDAAFGSLAYANGVAYVGCSDGLVAVTIRADGGDFAITWHNATQVADHPPTVAGGLVWAITSGGGTLVAFDPGTGAAASSFPIGSSTHFTTPAAANSQLYVTAGNRVLAFGGCADVPISGDFTGDGKADIALVSRRGVCVRPSTGTSLSAAQSWSSVPFYGNRATLAADVNGDGKTDLVAVNDSSVWVELSTGSSFSPPQARSSALFYGSKATLVADLNHSGRSDLVAVNSGSTWVMMNTGAGFSAPQAWSSTPFFGSRTTVAAEVDGDGRTDLVAVNDGSAWIMRSTGSAFAFPERWSAGAFYGSRGTVAADVNGDGRADLIAVNDSSVWVMTSTGASFLPPQAWSATLFYGSVATLAADVTGDGRADLVAVNDRSTWVEVSMGTRFGPPVPW